MHAPHGTLMPSEFPGLSAIRRSASVGPYDKILSHIAPMPTTLSLHATEDGEKVADSASNGGAGINFAVQLKQFEHMQQQHRMHRVVDSNLKPPRRPPIVSNQVSVCTSKFYIDPCGIIMGIVCWIHVDVQSWFLGNSCQRKWRASCSFFLICNSESPCLLMTWYHWVVFQNGQRAEDRPDSQFPRGFASEARVPPQSPRSPWS